VISHAKHNVAKYPVGSIGHHLVDHFAVCALGHRLVSVLPTTRYMANLLGPRSLGCCSLSPLAQMKWSASVLGSTVTKIEQLSRERNSHCRWLDFAFSSACKTRFQSLVRQMFSLEVANGRGNLRNFKELSFQLSITPYLLSVGPNGMVFKVAFNLREEL
jgi:hypothetical protein